MHVTKPIEIYDLSTDAAESKDLARDRPDLLQRAESIFRKAHRPDPNWPLDGRPEIHTRRANEAWAIKRERDKKGWIPENADGR